MIKHSRTPVIHTQKHKQLSLTKRFRLKGWIIDSVIDHNTNISKYNSLAGSSYVKLPKEFGHPGKRSINI